jgi:insertion element IS1 protein InsB
MVASEVCPGCGSTRYKKNGHIHTGKQTHPCKAGGRQFVLFVDQRLISEEQRALIERLFLERISLRGSCRAVGIGLKWLLGFLVERCDALPDHLHIQPIAYTPDVTIHRLEADADELWSFAGKKANKQWIWLAINAKTHQVIAFHVGDRGRESAKQLWVNIPAVYQQHAMFYTDLYEVYKGVMPPAPHQAITKKARKTKQALPGIGEFISIKPSVAMV